MLISVVLVLSFLLTGLATLYSRRRGLIDHPGERHSHSESTPRGGGIGLILALFLGSFLFLDLLHGFWINAVLPGAVVLSLLGWWDDHASLSARLRFFVQLAVSLFLLWCLLADGWNAGPVFQAIAVLFLLWMTNLYNFMDGSNGMVGSQGVFAGTVLAVLYGLADQHALALASAALAAACLGFLPWNVGRARVFMGDAGSIALGFAFGSLMIVGVVTEVFQLPVALLVMLVFLADASLTLLMRVIRRERWYNPHRQHLYQRLIASGKTHGSVLLFYQLINLVLVVPGIIIAVRFPGLAWSVTLFLIIVFAAGWYLITRKTGVLA